MPRIPLIWDITASNFPETLTPKNNMTLSNSSPLGHRGKANMTLNSTGSHNKTEDSGFYQMPNTATICRAPEGIERSEHFVREPPPLSLSAGNCLISTSSSTRPWVHISRQTLVQHGGPTRCLHEITLVPRRLLCLTSESGGEVASFLRMI